MFNSVLSVERDTTKSWKIRKYFNNHIHTKYNSYQYESVTDSSVRLACILGCFSCNDKCSGKLIQRFSVSPVIYRFFCQLSEDLSHKCETYCLTAQSESRIKELEAKVTELEGKLATLNESKVEYEEKVELKNDLFDDLNAKLDVMQNKVRGILQVNSKNKTRTVVHYTE